MLFTKSTTNNPKRLQRQCIKQQQFRERIHSTPLHYIFDVPKVYNTHQTPTSFSFEMQYINGHSIVLILEKRSITKIQSIVNNIFHLLDYFFSISETRPFNPQQLQTKLAEINKKTHQKYHYLTDPTYTLSQSLKGELFHQGFCHGDLTLSNMLFSDKIYLIDWHDPFLESPIQDVGKIYQEISLKWSYLMSPEIRDQTKAFIGYDHLSKLMNNMISKLIVCHNINPKIIHLFKLMTIIRLLPYTTNEHMKKIIISKIEELL